ncbi:MAG: helix-turn-helix domain-containing protein, partial [Nitrospirota bacterium]
IRELENTIESAVVLAENEEISAKDLPIISPNGSDQRRCWLLKSIEENTEKSHIQDVLVIVGGNKKRAATMLGLSYTTFWRKLKKYQIA